MAGDGINSAPALATADSGIAIGAAASDIALETADIALMGGQLAALPAAVTLARSTARVIAQNIALSLAAIAALDTATVTGHMSLAAGLLLNEGSAIVIIANGLRLRPPLDERIWCAHPWTSLKPGVLSAGRWQRILLAPMMLVRRR